MDVSLAGSFAAYESLCDRSRQEPEVNCRAALPDRYFKRRLALSLLSTARLALLLRHRYLYTVAEHSKTDRAGEIDLGLFPSGRRRWSPREPKTIAGWHRLQSVADTVLDPFEGLVFGGACKNSQQNLHHCCRQLAPARER